MEMRDAHCAFARLNGNGKCIAPCHYGIQSDTDCTGKEGRTLDSPTRLEARITGHKALMEATE